MNATLRGIDQVIFILAPVATGLVMTVSSMLSGALFIIAWNLVSVFAEYFLLYRVYKLVPALASKSQRSTRQHQEQQELKEDVEPSQLMSKEDSSRPEKHNAASEEAGCRRLCLKMLAPFITLKSGWTTYMRSELKYAGFALALIYLTVLGFDNVFTGYVYSQGLSQLYISIALGVGACCAIAATFAYPRLRTRVGVETTGLIGFSAEVTVLTLCVASVWLPGSPFSLTSPATTSADISTSSDLWANGTASTPAWYSSSAQPFVTNHSLANLTGEHVSTLAGAVPPAAPASMISVAVLLTGAILARFGVWTADLAVNQLLLERVDKSQRGVINGVQTALNTFMSMFEFIMVIVAPAPHTFGILVIVSFVCVATGDLFFIIYCRRSRGYVLCK